MASLRLCASGALRVRVYTFTRSAHCLDPLLVLSLDHPFAAHQCRRAIQKWRGGDRRANSAAARVYAWPRLGLDHPHVYGCVRVCACGWPGRCVFSLCIRPNGEVQEGRERIQPLPSQICTHHIKIRLQRRGPSTRVQRHDRRNGDAQWLPQGLLPHVVILVL